MTDKIAVFPFPGRNTKNFKPKPFAEGRDQKLSQSAAGRQRQREDRVFQMGVNPNFKSNSDFGTVQPHPQKRNWRIGQ